jgi:hypothetical protein
MNTPSPNSTDSPSSKGRGAGRSLIRGRATALQTAIVFLVLGTISANMGPQLGAAAELRERESGVARQLSALRLCIDHYKDIHGSYPDLSASFDALIAHGASAPVLTAAPVNQISHSATIGTRATPGNGWLYGGTTGPEAGTIFALDSTGKTLDF